MNSAGSGPAVPPLTPPSHGLPGHGNESVWPCGSDKAAAVAAAPPSAERGKVRTCGCMQQREPSTNRWKMAIRTAFTQDGLLHRLSGKGEWGGGVRGGLGAPVDTAL